MVEESTTWVFRCFDAANQQMVYDVYDDQSRKLCLAVRVEFEDESLQKFRAETDFDALSEAQWAAIVFDARQRFSAGKS